MGKIIVTLGILVLALPILTTIVYWLFLDSKIKNKKSILSFLEPTYKIVFWTILYCVFVNLIIFWIVWYVTTFEALGTMSGLMLQTQFIAYFVLLTIPKMFLFCLRISVRKEENGNKISFFEALKLFWRKSKRKQDLTSL